MLSLLPQKTGRYWGYEVRLAKGLAAVWSECPYAGGYDFSIGTSEHGAAVAPLEGDGLDLPSFRHLLIVFGGVEGLEPAVAAVRPPLASALDFDVQWRLHRRSKTESRPQRVACLR